MRIKELVKDIVADTLTDSEILKYCKKFEAEALNDLLQELWLEKEASEYVGKMSDAQRFDDVYKLVSEHFNVFFWKETLTGAEQKIKELLPMELRSDKAVKVFGYALDLGYITLLKDGYKWHLSNALLAYMCGKIYCEDVNKFNSETKDLDYCRGRDSFFPEAALNALFNVKNLGQSRLQMKHPPRGYSKIDNLFE